MIRRWLILLALPVCVTLSAQTGQPATQMHSVNTYETYTTLPMAARDLNGSLATDPVAQLPSSMGQEAGSIGSHAPRRVISGSDSSLNPGYNPNDPGNLVPIGEPVLPLFLMACLSLLLTAYKRKRHA